MITYEWTVDVSQIADLEKDFSDGVRRGIKGAGAYAVEVTRDEAPEGKTKKLKAGIHLEIEQTGGFFKASIVAEVKGKGGVDYVPFVVYGTGIYGPTGRRITAKNAKALRFDWHGGIMFRKSVAGQHPNDFMQRATDKLNSSTGMEERIERGIQI